MEICTRRTHRLFDKREEYHAGDKKSAPEGDQKTEKRSSVLHGAMHKTAVKRKCKYPKRLFKPQSTRAPKLSLLLLSLLAASCRYRERETANIIKKLQDQLTEQQQQRLPATLKTHSSTSQNNRRSFSS